MLFAFRQPFQLPFCQELRFPQQYGFAFFKITVGENALAAGVILIIFEPAGLWIFFAAMSLIACFGKLTDLLLRGFDPFKLIIALLFLSFVVITFVLDPLKEQRVRREKIQHQDKE